MELDYDTLEQIICDAVRDALKCVFQNETEWNVEVKDDEIH